jgi:hypothetical protein
MHVAPLFLCQAAQRVLVSAETRMADGSDTAKASARKALQKAAMSVLNISQQLDMDAKRGEKLLGEHKYEEVSDASCCSQE